MKTTREGQERPRPDIPGGNPSPGGTSPLESLPHLYHRVPQVVPVGTNGHEYVDNAQSEISRKRPIVRLRICVKCEDPRSLSHFYGPKAGFSHLRTEFCKKCYSKLNLKVRNHNKRASGTLTIDAWLRILEQSQGVCSYCQEHVGIGKLTIEHRLPCCKNGTNEIENIIAICQHCNGSKLGRDFEEWQRSVEAKRLLEELQAHLGLSAFEVKNLAMKTLAVQVGLVEVEA